MSIELTRRGGCVALGFSRGDGKNALDAAFVEELKDAFEQAVAMQGVRAVALRSAADGYFCVGMDLDALRQAREQDATPSRRAIETYASLLRVIAGAPVLTLALVEGLAVGGGVDLAAACDLTVATQSASFSIAQLRKGIFPLTTSALLIPKIGRGAFLLWALSGQYWSAQRARANGLVELVLEVTEAEPWLTRVGKTLDDADGETFLAGIDLIRRQERPELQRRIDLAEPFLARNCSRRGALLEELR